MSWNPRPTLTAIGFVIAALPPVLAQRPASSEEYRLKAAIVHRLPQFVEWPEGALDARDSLEICVAQPNPFGDALRQLTAGESLNGRRIAIREVAGDNDLTSCRVLFLSALRGNDTKLLARAATLPILTIGESPRFLDNGGIIRLHLVDRKVRFEIDARAAARSGLSVSSQLMRLASDVRGQR